jgi:hypothetical protein
MDCTSFRRRCNAARFRADDRRGHYESWFQRANHPSEPLAFWIRYTIFAPRDRPDRAVGELWAVLFDGRRNEMVARRREVPVSCCRFSPDALDVSIDGCTLTEGCLVGRIDDVSWDLRYDGGQDPLLLLPDRLYDLPIPKAKALVGRPMARFRGRLEVGDETVDVGDWVGSQNHNWGSRHTDRYVWGQVAGFDDDPEVFLECITAKLRVGPFWTPWSTLVVIRGLAPDPIDLRHVVTAVRARAEVDVPGRTWRFETGRGDLSVSAHLHAAPDHFSALRYGNPPGGSKTCLNTKIASCELRVRRGGDLRVLRTESRAAFELLVDPGEAPTPEI